MTYLKNYGNGLRLIVHTIEGLMSVSAGIIVKTGSANETEEENGISHFIEHTVFKGTKKRNAFEISDYVDGIGAQINAFTSKELTCFYTKSTADHADDCMEVLSDIFFDSVFDETELDKEKGVIIEEINMCLDTPEDLCLDILAEAYYGKEGFGRTILGPEKNIKRFNREDVKKYMDKYYTADNVVVSIAGNITFDEAEKITAKYFAERFKNKKSAEQFVGGKRLYKNASKRKKIEQSHIAMCFPTFSITDPRSDALSVANTVLGGGMSSRLFQKIREDLGLAYTVYSSPSSYKSDGVVEIYAGVNELYRDKAAQAIVDEVRKFRDGITEREFSRGKEQVKSSFVLSRESTASQMLLYGKYLLFTGEQFDFGKRLERINDISLKEVNDVIAEFFDVGKLATATVGPSGGALKIK